MFLAKPVLALAAVAALAACDAGQTTVSTPGSEPVVVDSADAVVVTDGTQTTVIANTPAPEPLTGTWDRTVASCSNEDSANRLVIQGNSFTFPTGQCTAISSTPGATSTMITLACEDAAERQLDVSVRPGLMRVTEGGETVTYNRCI